MYKKLIRLVLLIYLHIFLAAITTDNFESEEKELHCHAEYELQY